MVSAVIDRQTDDAQRMGDKYKNIAPYSNNNCAPTPKTHLFSVLRRIGVIPPIFFHMTILSAPWMVLYGIPSLPNRHLELAELW